MNAPAPLETLSALALLVWRHGLTERAQTLPELAARMESCGFFEPPWDVSLAARELVAAGWAQRAFRGYRHKQHEQIAISEST